MKYILPLFAVVLVSPGVASAQDSGGILDILQVVSNVLQALVPIIIGFAVILFIWGILKYIVAKSPEDKKEANGVILYGVIILFVMISIWGLVRLLSDTLGIDPERAITDTTDLIPR